MQTQQQTTEFKLTGRNAKGEAVAWETVEEKWEADQIAAGWRSSGLTVDVEEVEQPQ